MQFKLRSSSENDWTTIRNTEFISDYLDISAPLPSQTEQQTLGKLFAEQAWMRLKDLLEGDHGVSTDIIFTMIARNELHVRLDRDLLSEPERTKVFRDAAAAKAYLLHTEGSRLPAAPAHQSVTLEIGAAVLWDDTPYRISNVSHERIYLEEFNEQSGPKDGLKLLKRADFEGLVHQGLITGPTVTADLDWNALDAIFKHASPVDLELATLRYRNLFLEESNTKDQVLAPRTLRKFRAQFRQSEATCGSGFVGLLPKIHNRDNRERKLDPEVITIMDQVIDELYAHSAQRTITACWGEVCLRCKEQGFEAPSEKTFRTQIKRRQSHALLVAREGEKAAYTEEEYQ
jgi:putative transposase